ncbi:diaminopimelate decarboxylase [Rhodococcus sp. 27YEA15]|uniref:alanine racemase n=1 Tax=Rhodococcus sp. 27YEA15 TaxID=3156259 RepID=UPI003C7BA2BC
MTDNVRQLCIGTTPLDARLEPWIVDLLADPSRLADAVASHGSPLNVLHPGALARNAAELVDAAATADVDLRVFFARKANKALTFVDAAKDAGLGVDVASERELRQVLDRGVDPSDIIVTAAVKPRSALSLALRHGVTVALDNTDEAQAYLAVAADSEPASIPVALRLASSNPDIAPTRFGLSHEQWLQWLDEVNPQAFRIEGIHFHLHGYDPAHRAVVLGEAMALVDELHTRGHRPTFVDMGGGIPMSYLDDSDQWEQFGHAHRRAVLGEQEPLTWRGDGLGLSARDGRIEGTLQTYPFHQSMIRGGWISAVAEAFSAHTDVALGACLRSRGVRLHCEPGRSLLDGCGMTVASVVFRKTSSDGIALIGLEMNRTQCRSTSADYLVDPILLRSPQSGPPGPPTDGFLVGAYCIEEELILRRRLRFPAGVAVGDLLVLPNTAGYLMHILESESHQLPLARNVLADNDFALDAIDL